MNALLLRAARLAALVFVLPVTGGAQTLTAVEYYYQAWDHYFVTAFPDEIAVLDGGAFGGVWKRTGKAFDVWPQALGNAVPACRFFSTAFAPRSSHFYTPFTAECTSLKTSASWQYESDAFFVSLPDAAGACAAGTVVLYRLYNNGMGGAPNHRYTTDAATFAAMQAQGWTFEGDGRTGAFACVPAAAPKAEGLWRGSSADGRAITVVVLEDGTYYIAYSNVARSSLDGGLQGVASLAGGQLTSTLGRNVGLRALLADGSTVVAGTFVARTSLDLTIGTGGTAQAVSATYDTAYDVTASAAAVAGSYRGVSGHTFDAFASTMTVDATGRLNVHGGCEHHGQITPHAGKGVFDLQFYNGCLPPGSPAQTGILIYDAVRGTITTMAPLNADDMVFVFGTRQ